MSKIFRMEYDTPEATIYTLPVLSAICVSQRGASIQSFQEDDELDW